MKTISILRYLLFSLAFVITALLGSIQPAQADVIDDFASLLDKLDEYHANPWASQGINGSAVRASKALFQCIEGGTDVLVCIDNFGSTPLGQKLASDARLPSWVEDLLDAYIAFKEKDFWYFMAKLGESVACAIAQFFTSLDICGLFEDLLKAAEAVYDLAKAVAEFLADLGEAAKELGCLVGLGGCDDHTPTIEELAATAYAWVFYPELSQGLQAIETANPYYTTVSLAFENLVKRLRDDALANPARLHIPIPDSSIAQEAFKITFPKEAVDRAENQYRKSVDELWSGDIQRVATELAAKRSQYIQDFGKVLELAKIVVQKASLSRHPGDILAEACAEDFSFRLGYEHVDRWIATHKDKASQLKLKYHREWCDIVYWATNRNKFKEPFRNLAKTYFCPGSGQNLMCSNISNYQYCTWLLGSVGIKDQCGLNTGLTGKEAAQKIIDEINKQSSYPCTIAPQLLVNSPAVVVCTRPTLAYECNLLAKTFNDITAPRMIVQCSLKETPEYKALREKVAKAVETLNKKYPSSDGFRIDPLDPLIVAAPPDQFANVQKDNPDFGFGPPSKKTGFEYYPLMKDPHRRPDGVDTPAMWAGTTPPTITKAPELNQVQEKIVVKKGDPDPTKFGSITTMQPVESASSSLAGAEQAKLKGPQQQMQTRSMEMPSEPSPGVPTGAPGAEKLSVQPSAQTIDAGMADIQSAPRVTVAGKSTVSWGATVTISDSAAENSQNGICEVEIQYDVINAGNAASGPFAGRWVNSQNPSQVTVKYPSIPAGESLQKVDKLPLKPGTNKLTLTLDYLNQVKEKNETNNTYNLTVTVTGKCGLTPKTQADEEEKSTPGTHFPNIQQQKQGSSGTIRPPISVPKR